MAVTPLAGSDFADQGLPGQRELHEIGACRSDDGSMKRARRVLKQLRHGPHAQYHVVPVRMAYRRDAFAGEEKYGNALRDDEGKQQQQREPAREAFGHQPHSRSTLPVNR